jgi:hypothetical protein
LTNETNWCQLGYLRHDELETSISDKIDGKTELSVRKIVNGFKGFGFEPEAEMVLGFLKCFSKAKGGDFVFTVEMLTEYLN